MSGYHVKGWGDFQHYKDRSPAWIKLHKKLLDDYEYQCLPVASRALAPMLWLLASESLDGSIDSDLTKIGFRLRMTEKEVQIALKPLVDNGFFIAASDMLADGYSDSSLEKRREEIEIEKRKRQILAQKLGDGWEAFWIEYPRKVAKGQAEKAWKTATADCTSETADDFVTGVLDAVARAKFSDQWRKDGGQFIPYPATWLRSKGWLDESVSLANVLPVKQNNIEKRISLVTALTTPNDPERIEHEINRISA